MANYTQLRQITPLLTGFKDDTKQLIPVTGETPLDKGSRTPIIAIASDTVYICRGHDKINNIYDVSEAVLTAHTKNSIPVVHLKRSDVIQLRAVNYDEMGLTKEQAVQNYPYTKRET